MAPTYTMSAHLCKAVYTSWCEMRQPYAQAHPQPSRIEARLPHPAPVPYVPPYCDRSPTPEKRSMDSDRSEAAPSMSRQSSNSSYKSDGSR